MFGSIHQLEENKEKIIFESSHTTFKEELKARKIWNKKKWT